MKKIIILAAFALLIPVFSQAANAPKATSDTTVVVKTSPVMHCANCEKKIKSNIRFVKGVKNIETNRDNQTVTIRSDKKSFNRQALDKAFAKIGFKISDAN